MRKGDDGPVGSCHAVICGPKDEKRQHPECHTGGGTREDRGVFGCRKASEQDDETTARLNDEMTNDRRESVEYNTVPTL